MVVPEVSGTVVSVVLPVCLVVGEPDGLSVDAGLSVVAGLSVMVGFSVVTGVFPVVGEWSVTVLASRVVEGMVVFAKHTAALTVK